MNKYEGMFLLDHGRLKNEPQRGIDEITAILEKHGAKVVQIGRWDERKLAYEINRQKRGTYIMAHFEAPIETIREVHGDVKLSENISRSLIIRLGNVFPPFMTATELETEFGTRDFRDRPGRRSDSRDRRPAPRQQPVAAAPAAAAPVADVPATPEGEGGSDDKGSEG